MSAFGHRSEQGPGMGPGPDAILDWIDDEYLTAGSMTLRYRRLGSGAAQIPLVLVNGIGAPLEMWAPFVEQISARDVIVFDLPGSGRSSTPTFPVTMAWFADTIAAFLDGLGLTRVDLLGFSFGGVVAQEFTFRYPKRVRRLVLTSTTPGFPVVPGNPVALAVAATPLRYLDRALGEAMIPALAGGQTLRDLKLMESELWRRQLEPPSMWGYTVQLIAISMWSGHLRLPSVRCPVLVVHGGEDPLCPEFNARWMANLLPDCEYLMFPEAGHLVLIDEPHRAAGPIKSFLDHDGLAV